MSISSWNSITEIVEEYELASAPSEVEAVRQELRAKLADLHPDRDGGEFPTPAQKEAYFRISSAIDFVEATSQSNASMVRVSDVTAIAKVIADALVPARRTEFIEARQHAFIASYQQQISRDFLLPKIGSGVFAAIAGALFTFAGQLKDHPFFGPLMTSRAGTPSTVVSNFLLGLFLMSGMLFITSWFREQRRLRYAEFIVSDSGLADSFQSFLRDAMNKGEPQFRRGKYIDWLSGQLGHRRPVLDRTSADNLGDVHLQKLLLRNLVHKVDSIDIEDAYEVDGRYFKRFHPDNEEK